MKKRGVFLAVILGLGISSATSLINRFIVAIPDWLGIASIIIAIVLIIFFFVRNSKNR